ncbi:MULTISPECIES: glycosyltransferase family 4 protein [unclassified Luteibacter]|uniref:glycosyltransferase family 4 protein n=1 Tax=Luteibacter sp. PvP019 TaxID=3156436 RepID=UPI0033924D86
MKLAIVLPGGVDRSGEYRVIPVFLALIERLARRHEVHVFVLYQEPLPATWRLVGAKIHNIGRRRSRLRAVAAIRAEHRIAPFDLVQSIFSGDCGLIAVVAAMLIARPSAVHVAGGELVALHAIGYGGRRDWKGRLRETFVLRFADAVTAASAPIIDALRGLRVAARRLPLGVDLDAWPVRAPRRRAQGTARLIHVASLNRVKDQTTLLHAMARVTSPFVLDIVGVDTLDGEIHALAQRLGLDDRVHFLGFRTQRQLQPLLVAADLLLVSSLHEAGPLVVLEAAVAGVPTVGTAVGHLVEWAPAAALAVPVNDAGALAGCIQRVLDDEDLRLRLAREAQQRAVAEDADMTSRAFETLYREVRARRGAVSPDD